MAGQDNDDKIVELLKQAYPPAAASPGFREKLRRRLDSEVVAPVAAGSRPLWQPSFLWPAAAAVVAIALALIFYLVLVGSTPPAVTTNEATDITTGSAILNGNLDALGSAGRVDVSFEWGGTTDYGNETASESITEAGVITANLSGLNPNTTYHFRARAVGDGTAYGADMLFTTGTTPPLVTTSDATNRATTSATLNGDLTALGTVGSVTVSFEWGPTSGGPYTGTTGEVKNSTGPFYFELGGLASGTTYYYKAKAVGDGTSYGAEMSFTTLTTPPSVTTNDASNLATTSARLNGDLTSLGTAGNVDVSFEWGLTTSYGSETAPEPKAVTGTYGADLSGLSPNTTYHFRAKAIGQGTAYGADMQFTTGTTPPSVATNDASNLATTSATLNGDLTTLGTAGNVTVSFEWGTALGLYTYEATSQTRTIPEAFYFDVSGLSPGTTYYYRAKAMGDGTNYGVEKSFTTLTAPPVVTTNSATEIHCTSAMLNGILDSLGTADNVTVSFEWGTTTGYGNETALEPRTSTGTFSANMTGLIPNTTYHFRAKAVGDDITYGADRVFTTSRTPPPQKTWYLSSDDSGNLRVMYDDASTAMGLVTLGTSEPYSQIWIDGQSSGGTFFPAGNWAIHLTLNHFGNNESVNVEIGTWDGSTFASYGIFTFPQGQGNSDYMYDASLTVSPFTVPSGGWVAIRITLTTSPGKLNVHVGGSQSYVTSPSFPEPAAPIVVANAAGSVDRTSAILDGYLDSLGTADNVTVYFEWGTTTDYGNQTAPQPKTATGSFNAILTDLTPNTTYYFRAKAIGDGTNYSVDIVFTTPP